MTIEHSSLSPHQNAAFHCFFVQQLRHHRQRWRLSHSSIDNKSSPKHSKPANHDQTVKPALPHACQQGWVKRRRCVSWTRGCIFQVKPMMRQFIEFCQFIDTIVSFSPKNLRSPSWHREVLATTIEPRLVSTCSLGSAPKPNRFC